MGKGDSKFVEICMKGNIYTAQKCALCGGALVHDERRRGLFCKNHPQIGATKGFRVHFGNEVKRRFKSYDLAEQFLAGLRYKSVEGTFDARDYRGDSPLGFATQVRKWLVSKQKQVKPNTCRDIKRDVEKVIKSWNQANVKTLGFAEIEDFLLSLDVAAKTRANTRATLAQFFKWCSKRERFSMPDMPDIKYELGWRNIIDMHTQRAVIDHVKKICPDFKVYLGIRWLATYVAIRPNELRNLKERHINVNGFFVIPSPKEKKPKLVPMLQADIEIVESLPRGLPDLYFFRHTKGNGAAAPGQQYGKDNFYRWWKRACQELGIEGVDLYGGTRHSSASELGKHFSAQQIRDHMTMHSTNKAFERYMQTEAAPSLAGYEKLREISKQKKKE